MKFPQYVSTNERTVSVVGMIDKKNLKPKEIYINGKGYVDENDDIWIFCSDGKPRNKNAYPYFWFNEAGEVEFSDPAELIKKAFSVNNMKDISLVNIIEKTTPGEQLFDETEINDMNAAAAFFVPTIYESDDFLKKIVKTVIIEKGIDINRLKCKTEEKYILPNMKAALQNKTKMSVIYFCCWMELLGCDFDITILDNSTDSSDPLKNPLVYQSNKDNISVIINGELRDLDHGKYQNSDDEEEE